MRPRLPRPPPHEADPETETERARGELGETDPIPLRQRVTLLPLVSEPRHVTPRPIKDVVLGEQFPDTERGKAEEDKFVPVGNFQARAFPVRTSRI
jgi:hypothetical protein